jgi:hypothetical protein
MSREQELEGLLREIAPAVRDILWCALVWNDHNFDERALFEKATRAADSLGLNRHNGVYSVNWWMERVDKALGCLNEMATGRIAVYPDACPHCRCAVAVASTNSGGTEHG